MKEMNNELVCYIKDDNGGYYCVKRDVDFFLNNKFKDLNGEVVEELTIEEVEARHDGESCFVLSREQYGE